MDIFLPKARRPIEIIHVAPYIPRECGIATYTKDLVTAINFENIGNISRIFALDESGGTAKYPEEVIETVPYDTAAGFKKAAAQINKSDAKIVHLQHEFGLFGGAHGSMILNLTDRLDKKLVITFHTILASPPIEMREVVRRLGRKASLIITMTKVARQRLIDDYGVMNTKIELVHHGVPSFPDDPPSSYKKKLSYSDRNFIISTFGLISRNKGLEYGIEAMAEISKEIPDARYIIIGKTHPNILKAEGESYLDSLKQLAEKLNIADKIVFVNRFLPLAELADYLMASDVYLTPYLVPDQISSGTLSYALAAGKPCISTPYTYAQEMLARQGLLVPFRDKESIAEGILYYYYQVEQRLKAARYNYRLGLKMSWPNVGRRHLALFGKLLNAPVSVRTDSEKDGNLLLNIDELIKK